MNKNEELKESEGNTNNKSIDQESGTQKSSRENLKRRVDATQFDGINENPEAKSSVSRSSYAKEDEELQENIEERNLDISHESVVNQPPSLP